MSARFATLPPLELAENAPNADERNDWTSLAEGSLQASSRRRDAGLGKTGTNRPVRESHANRNKTVGDLAASDRRLAEAVA
jgi:hypothetical protein